VRDGRRTAELVVADTAHFAGGHTALASITRSRGVK